MRNALSAALMAAIVGLLGVPRQAGATVTFSLVWVETTGAGVTGTNAIFALPGDQMILAIQMTNDQTLYGHAVSIEWDRDFKDELDVWRENNWNGITFGAPGMTTVYAPLASSCRHGLESTGLSVGYCDTYNSAVLSGPGFLPVGTYTIGTLRFVATPKITNPADGPDIFVGLFTTGVDGVLNNQGLLIPESSLVFGTASIYGVPEPGTASLLGMGLLALVLAGRRRRRA